MYDGIASTPAGHEALAVGTASIFVLAEMRQKSGRKLPPPLWDQTRVGVQCCMSPCGRVECLDSRTGPIVGLVKTREGFELGA